MEKGEHLTIPLRVWRGLMNATIASVTTEDAQRKSAAAPDAVPRVEGPDLPQFPAGSVTYRIRPGGNQRSFWIDIELSGVNQSGRFAWSANVTDPATGESFPIGVSALVFEENLIVNPKSLDAPELSLGSLKDAPVIAARLNLRKMIGSIHIKAVSSTLGFVKGGVQVLIDGSNYLVKAYVIANPGVGPGKYEGTIKIETDDPAHRQIDVPFKVTFTP